MKLEKETALYDPNAIAKEISNFTNEIVEINGGLQQIEQQIDGQVVTWFYNYTPTLNNLPASGWDSDEKELHLGDIFYNTTTYLAYIWSKSGSTYSWNRISNKDLTTALQTATIALDTADKKRRVFISTSSQQNPTPPYDYGDIWFQGEYYDKDILTCVYSDGRPEGASFVRNDWAKLNKYTDDSALTTFLNGTYSSDKTNLQSQIDKKAETWYQSGDPSTAWTTEALKAEHEGDLWYKTTDQKTYRYSKINNVYSWQQENVPTEVFDKIDKKAAIYTSQPDPPYNVGDLWFNSASSDILTCINPKTSDQYFVSADWVKRNKYTDDEYAQTLASRIGDVPQYFWHNESAVGNEGAGAHITEIPKEDFINDPEHGGANLLANSGGIAARIGIREISTFGINGQTFNNEYSHPIFEVGRLPSSTYNRKANWTTYNGASPWKWEIPWDFVAINEVHYYDSSHEEITMSPEYSINGRDIIYNGTSCAELQNNNVRYIKINYKAVGQFPYFTIGSDGAGEIGPYSYREGENVVASGITSHAEGDGTTASGSNSHAEGGSTSAVSNDAHSEGYYTTAGGDSLTGTAAAHAEGYRTTASGLASHAEGSYTSATRTGSHAGGYHTIADQVYQTAIGEYNTANNTNNLFVVGNGTADDARSDAFQVDQFGNVKAAGNITAGNHATEIGHKTERKTGTYSLASGTTWVTVPSGTLSRITLGEGTWIIHAHASFESNSTGRRALQIYNTTGSNALTRSFVNQNATNGAATNMQTSAIETLSANTTYTVQLVQNSGSAKSVDLVLEAVRIA